MSTDNDLEVEAEPFNLCDELRPAASGIFPQTIGELIETFDPYGDCSSTYLWENH